MKIPPPPVTRNGYKAIKQPRSPRACVLTAIYSYRRGFSGSDEWRRLLTYVNRMCNYGDGGQVFDLMQMLETQGLNSKILAIV